MFHYLNSFQNFLPRPPSALRLLSFISELGSGGERAEADESGESGAEGAGKVGNDRSDGVKGDWLNVGVKADRSDIGEVVVGSSSANATDRS